MRTIDFSPLFRSTVGFDRMQLMLDAATRVDDAGVAYPPYNIETQGEDAYRITMAVAGFTQDELDITVKENAILIAGKAEKADGAGEYLHRGIAKRAFERRFQLADHIRVVGAALADGLLHVDLVREVPEEKRPRKVAIETTGGATAISKQAA